MHNSCQAQAADTQAQLLSLEGEDAHASLTLFPKAAGSGHPDEPRGHLQCHGGTESQ